jgi:glucokinase
MSAEKHTQVIGVDLGATNIRGAIVSTHQTGEIEPISTRIHSDGTQEDVLDDIYQVIDELLVTASAGNNDIAAIGIGVPSVVDLTEGIVYDVQYIPSWKEVPLKKLLEAKYRKPALVNNDANCFALGEYYFGKQPKTSSMVGLTIGTGLGGGIIINHKLFPGYNCGAGEFGLLPYKDNILEYYCSGSFFKNVYNKDGLQVFEDAKQGDAQAKKLYAELGTHVGQAIKAIIYTYDPELIVLGGSVSEAHDLFKDTMWEEIKTLAYGQSAQRIRIHVSELKNGGILGAAALYFNAQ